MINQKKLMDSRGQALMVSLLVVLVGLGAIAYRGGLLYGIEFTGGFRMMFEFNQPISADQLGEFRSGFEDGAYDAAITTFSVSGEEPMRGLMVTARTDEAVDRISELLDQAGEAGDEEIFSQLASHDQFGFLDEETLREEFAFGEGSGLDLTTAEYEEVRSRTEDVVNETFNRVIESRLRSVVLTEEPEYDLNAGSSRDLQQWLIEGQIRSLTDNLWGRLDSISQIGELEDLLNRYQIPPGDFSEWFALGEADQRLNLRELDRQEFRDIIREEFFSDRYEDAARTLVEQRERAGIFESVDQVLSASVMESFDRDRLKELAGLTPFRILQEEMVSPALGTEMVWDALLAVLISLIGVLGYLYARFEFYYSLGAIIAIIHDVIITVGLITLFGVEFNVPVVAALLTVIGYSLNDTIVNFDRVRENRTLMGFRPSWQDVIDRSVYEVLPRTFATSLTTFVAVAVLYFFGGIALYGFSVTLIVGVIVGTYSSIFVSNASLLWLYEQADG